MIPEQPDIEAFVWEAVRGDGITSWIFDASPMPLVPWLVAYQLQIDARARTRSAARDRAERVRHIVWSLGSIPWAAGVVSYVQITDGPFYLPDGPDGGPRYVMRAEIRAHPNRS